MVTVRVKEVGGYLDVEDSVTFVKQVADMGDITKATSSYTWQLKFPKTPNNFRIFSGLGVSGSLSRVPYIKITCEVLYNGQMIEPNGNLIITETDRDYYKGHVKAGIIDFLQDLSNETISDTIDLSELSHENNVSNIIDSFTNDLPYKYVVAYYNGSPLPDVSNVTNLNPAGIVPSISVKYLWDKIFEKYGWTYSGNIDLDDEYMTYPNAVSYSEDDSINVLNANAEFPPNYVSTTNPNDRITDYNLITNLNPSYINETEDGIFEVLEAGNYKISANVFGYAVYNIAGGTNHWVYYFRLRISGQPVTPWIETSPDNVAEVTATLQAGDTVHVEILAVYNVWYSYTYIKDAYLRIETLGVDTIDFSEALIKLKARDFFKEILVRKSLTPFVDVENKAIRFKTLDERLTAPAVDWSNKYVDGSQKEKYVYESYSQKNLLTHKYNNENEDWANGVMYVDNENQPDEKTLYSSFSYAPEEGVIEFKGFNDPSYNVRNFKMFEVEAKENTSGDVEVDYKQLKDRFYFMKVEQKQDRIYVLNNITFGFPIAKSAQVFSEIVPTKYGQMNQLIDNAKIVNVDLNLSLADIVMLDFYKRYYFEQEKAYFILNKVTWKPNKMAQAELIKINS